MGTDQILMAFFVVATVLSFCLGVLSITKEQSFEAWLFGWLMGTTFPFILALAYGMVTGWEPAC